MQKQKQLAQEMTKKRACKRTNKEDATTQHCSRSSIPTMNFRVTAPIQSHSRFHVTGPTRPHDSAPSFPAARPPTLPFPFLWLSLSFLDPATPWRRGGRARAARRFARRRGGEPVAGRLRRRGCEEVRRLTPSGASGAAAYTPSSRRRRRARPPGVRLRRRRRRRAPLVAPR